MNNWLKLGMAGVALAGSLNAVAQETPPEAEKPKKPAVEMDEGSFSIEASDLIAKKLRDHVKVEQAEEIA